MSGAWRGWGWWEAPLRALRPAPCAPVSRAPCPVPRLLCPCPSPCPAPCAPSPVPLPRVQRSVPGGPDVLRFPRPSAELTYRQILRADVSKGGSDGLGLALRW
ncbi:hypothetical protein GCM10027075_40610 [Streptomyces heilongjiangensis]